MTRMMENEDPQSAPHASSSERIGSMRYTFIGILFFLLPLGARAQHTDYDRLYRLIAEGNDSADVALKTQLLREPDNPRLLLLQSNWLLAQKRFNEAIPLLYERLTQTASDTAIYTIIGRAYEEQRMIPEAIEAYQKSMRWKQNPILLRIKLAALYHQRQQWNRSIEILKDLSSSPAVPLHVHALLGRSYIKMESPDSAIVVSRQALKRDSTDFPNLLNLGIALFQEARLNKAAAVLREAIRISPNSDEAHYYLGETYTALDERADAIRELERCIRLEGPYRLKALRSLIVCHYRYEQLEACIRTAESFLQMPVNEYSGLAHYYLGRAFSDDGSYPEADYEFEEAVKLTNLGLLLSTNFYRALNCELMGDFKEAIRLYKKTITIEPRFSFAYYNLALIYNEYYADKDPAIAYFEKYIELAEKDPDQAAFVVSSKEKLKQIKERRFFERANTAER